IWPPVRRPQACRGAGRQIFPRGLPYRWLFSGEEDERPRSDAAVTSRWTRPWVARNGERQRLACPRGARQNGPFRATFGVQTPKENEMFLFGKTREGWLHGEDRAPGARKSRERSRSGDRRRARFQLEPLEGRQLLSWGSLPPALITPPVNSPPSTYVYPEALSALGDAQGSNRNVGGEVDFYRFTTPVAGTYHFDATSPGHAVDTVIAVYDASGNRLGYNDDIAPGNHDSETSVALQAGHQYFLGVTNYISNTTHGSYNWSIDGPAHLAPVEQAIVDLTNQERQSAG